MALFLGLDVGTQSTKAVLWSPEDNRVHGRGSVAYDLLPTTVPGRAEQHPSTWIEAVKGATRQALAAAAGSGGGGGDPADAVAARVRGVAVSGQQHGLVLLDAEGEVVRPAKLWCDTESAAEAEELSAALGRPLPAAFTATKVLWVARHEPEAWRRAAKVMLPHDYVNHWLTGGELQATEASDASGTGVFDAAARAWDLDAAAKVDARLPRMLLPEIAPPGAAVGDLCAAAAEAMGLGAALSAAGGAAGSSSGGGGGGGGGSGGGSVKVGPGGGDNAMAALGSGVTRPGELIVSLGTSGTLFGVSSAPVLDASGVVAPFCDAAGRWLPLACTLNCTVAAEEVRRAFGSGGREAQQQQQQQQKKEQQAAAGGATVTATAGMSREELTRLAALEPPGCEGVTLLPFFVGERTPNAPHATGALLGLRPGHMARPGLLYRACLEGCTFALRAALARMRALGMPPATAVRLVGGGAANVLWRQVVADALGLPVEVPPGESAADGAALGAAFQAAAVVAALEGGPGADDVGEYARAAQAKLRVCPAGEAGAGAGAAAAAPVVVVQPDPAARGAYDAAYRRFVEASGRLFETDIAGGGVDDGQAAAS